MNKLKNYPASLWIPMLLCYPDDHANYQILTDFNISRFIFVIFDPINLSSPSAETALGVLCYAVLST